MRKVKMIALAWATGTLAAKAVSGQSPVRTSMTTISAWFDASGNPRVRTTFGEQRRGIFAFGLGLQRRIAGDSIVRLDYVAELIPAELVANSPLGPLSCSERCSAPRFGVAYGFALAPAGARVSVRATRVMSVDLKIAAGMARFDHNVPDPDSRRVNFQGRVVLALNTVLSKHRTVSVGAAWMHISNAHTVAINPGLNALGIVVGVEAR